ncbi:MAG: hypothetical protein ACRDLM_05995 [Gaiellaceae bacterium]
MTPPRREEDGIPRARRVVTVPPGGAAREEDWSGANEAMAEKLRSKDLGRRARELGMELRHSDSGYALIDAARKHVDDRSDLSLSEVESRLKRS